MFSERLGVEELKDAYSRWLQPYFQILDKAGKAERDKPTSLFGPFVNYKKNSFMTYLK
jgi:hypothetical protein